MELENNKQFEEINSKDSSMGEEMYVVLDGKGKKKKSRKIDRSGCKYSEKDFLQMPRAEQLVLAEKYWNGPVADFDDGTFQFSSTHFATLCQKIGFRKGVVDTLPENATSDQENTSSVIYIDHGRREATEVKKFTLAKGTIEKMDQLLGDTLSNVERSKVIDAILVEALEQKLAEQRAGMFKVVYRPLDEERIL